MKKRSKIYRSFEELYRDNESIIFGHVDTYAKRNGLSEQDRDELVEQVWYKAGDKATHLLTLEIPAVCVYLKRTAQSVVADDARIRKRKTIEVEYVDPGILDQMTERRTSSVEEELFGDDMEYYLNQILDTLNEDDKTLILLYYYESLTAKQVAGLIGSTEGAVRMKLTRLKRKMRELCEKEIEKGEGYCD